MTMISRHHIILSLLAFASLAGIASSCTKESFSDLAQEDTPPSPTMGITISLAGSTRAGDGDPGKELFEPGTGYENYLDIKRDNYRIYFFDSEGKYIDTFHPLSCPTETGSEEVNGVQTVYYYRFLGKAPSDLPTRFKVVTIFNWPMGYLAESDTAQVDNNYKLKKGETTIYQLCNHNLSIFQSISPDEGEPWLDPENDRMIPFYGVREYDLADYVNASDIETGPDGNPQIKGDIYIDLSKDNGSSPTHLPLLRAMAKVEVILDNPLASFDKVEISRVNSTGYCAPENAMKHSDYDHGYVWDSDFMRKLHLPGDGNDDPEYSFPLSMTKVSGGFDKEKYVPEKWVAYIPEYMNIGVGENFCSIKVTLANPDSISFRNPDEAPKGEDDKRPVWNPEKQTNTIYFATNGTKVSNDKDVQASAATAGRYNIERNNIYRFIITGMNAKLSCELDVQPYADCPLTVDFGLMRDESGDLMVLPDSYGNLPDYFKAYMAGKEWPKDASGNRLIPHNDDDNNDYFAIRLTSSGEIRDAEVWLKDKDGCQILSNFGVADGNDGCSARMVRDYSTLTVTEYYKEKDGDQRLQHNDDHSSVVLNHEKEMLFKTKPFDGSPDNPLEVKNYLVESWDKESGKFWYVFAKSGPFVATEENIREALGNAKPAMEFKKEHELLIGKTVTYSVLHEGQKSGKDTGNRVVLFDEYKKEETSATDEDTE